MSSCKEVEASGVLVLYLSLSFSCMAGVTKEAGLGGVCKNSDLVEGTWDCISIRFTISFPGAGACHSTLAGSSSPSLVGRDQKPTGCQTAWEIAPV